jgi:hypothetical protein
MQPEKNFCLLKTPGVVLFFVYCVTDTRCFKEFAEVTHFLCVLLQSSTCVCLLLSNTMYS